MEDDLNFLEKEDIPNFLAKWNSTSISSVVHRQAVNGTVVTK